MTDEEEQEAEAKERKVVRDVPRRATVTSACTAKSARNTTPATEMRHPIRPILVLTRRPRRQMAATRAATPNPESATQTALCASDPSPKASSPACPAKISTPAKIAATPVRESERDDIRCRV